MRALGVLGGSAPLAALGGEAKGERSQEEAGRNWAGEMKAQGRGGELQVRWDLTWKRAGRNLSISKQAKITLHRRNA